jgi:hypothetical protein
VVSVNTVNTFSHYGVVREKYKTKRKENRVIENVYNNLKRNMSDKCS